MSITMIGLDTAKSVFQVHGVNETGKVEIKRKLRRSELIPFFEKLETALLSWRRAVLPITGPVSCPVLDTR
jgi:transposase